MTLKYGWLLVVLLLSGITTSAQNPRKQIRRGNKAFEKGKFPDAEVDYRKALAVKPDYEKGKFNLGDALYEQKNMDEAGKTFKELAETSKNPSVKSEAWYNYGNTLLAQKKYREAMQAFKNALLLNPKDQDAKYNYEYARKKMIEQQKKQQNKKQQNKKNQDKKKNDKKKDNKKNKDKNKNKNKDKDKDKDKDKNKNKEQNKKEKQKEQNKEKQDNKDQQQKKKQQKQDQDRNKSGDQQKQQRQPQQPQQISKKDAERMLKALKNDEKKTLHKLQKQKAKAVRAKKSDIDW